MRAAIGLRRHVSATNLSAALAGTGLVALALASGGNGPEERALAGLVIWWLVAVGLAFGAFRRTLPAGPGTLFGLILVGFAGLTGLSLAWASDDGRAFQDLSLATLYAGVAILGLAAVRERGTGPLLRGLALGLLAIAGLALASRLFPESFTDQVAANLPSARSRLSYPIGYWNALGLVVALAATLMAWLSAAAARPRTRAAAVAVIPALGLVLYLTSSRGGVLALAIALGALLLLEARRVEVALSLVTAGIATAALVAAAAARPAFADGLTNATASREGDEVLLFVLGATLAAGLARLALDRPLRRAGEIRPRPGVLAAVAGLVLSGAVVMIVVAVGQSGNGAEPRAPSPAEGDGAFVTQHLASSDSSGRRQFWEAALDAFGEQPVRGLGAGSFEAWWAREGTLAYHVRNAHSHPLETLAELGAVGGLLLLGLVITTAVALWRGARVPAPDPHLAVLAALALAGAVSASIDWTWEVPAALAPAVLAAALLTGLPPRSQRTSYGWGVATIAVAWCAIVVSAIALITETQLDQSRAATARGDLAEAASDALDAAAIQPWAAAPRLQLALVEERRGDLPAARRAAAEAVLRARHDWRVWLVRARIEAKAGHPAAGIRALERARCLNPRSPLLARPDPAPDPAECADGG